MASDPEQAPPDLRAPDERLFRLIGTLLTVLVLVQATLAGQFLNTQTGGRAAHRVIGEFLGLVAVALAAQGYRLRRISPTGWRLSVAALVLVLMQTGLGFAGRDTAWAAALHVPVGVVSFGVALLTAVPMRTRSVQTTPA